MYSWYCSYLGKELSGIKNPQAKLVNAAKIALVVSDNGIAPGSHGYFQNKIVGWIWQERTPEKKYFLAIGDFTQKINEVADVFISYLIRKLPRINTSSYSITKGTETAMENFLLGSRDTNL